MVVLFNVCIKIFLKLFKIYFLLYFVFLLYNVYVFVMCIFFVGGGGEIIILFMEKKRYEINIWIYIIFEYFIICLVINDFNLERL